MATTRQAPNRLRPGRTAGSPHNRDAILTAAKQEFAAHGFDLATVRGVARRAKVDPALIYHYFGSKNELFSEVIRLPVGPREFALQVVAGPTKSVGERLARHALELWNAHPPAWIELVHSVTSRQEAVSPRIVLDTITKALGVPQPRLRASLVYSQIIGLALAKFAIGIEPISSVTDEELVAFYAPTLQRHLTGHLPGD